MALMKAIELDNGIVLNYHRIVALHKITNKSIIIEISSYTNATKREQEIRQIENNEEITAYTETSFISVPYDEVSTIKDWYNYLKTTETYKDANDA